MGFDRARRASRNATFLLAAGLSPDEVEAEMKRVDEIDPFDDRPPRPDLSYRRKLDDVRDFIDLELGIRNGRITLPRGLIAGQKIDFLFIEERHAHGEPLREALFDAGIIRLRPVLITVGATVFGLFPLAAHGGPLWEPLCYTQIGGLTLATFVTLLMVPVLYAICVLDLRLVQWDRKPVPGN